MIWKNRNKLVLWKKSLKKCSVKIESYKNTERIKENKIEKYLENICM